MALCAVESERVQCTVERGQSSLKGWKVMKIDLCNIISCFLVLAGYLVTAGISYGRYESKTSENSVLIQKLTEKCDFVSTKLLQLETDFSSFTDKTTEKISNSDKKLMDMYGKVGKAFKKKAEAMKFLKALLDSQRIELQNLQEQFQKVDYWNQQRKVLISPVNWESKGE